MLWLGLFTAAKKGKKGMAGMEGGGQLDTVRAKFGLHFCAALNCGGVYFENTEAIQSLFELPVSVSYLETLILGASGKPRSTHRM